MSPQTTVPSSDEVALYAAIFGAVAAIIGGFLAGGLGLIVSWWCRPKLEIEFVDSKHITDLEWEQDGTRISRRYVIAKVFNRGKTTAQNCRVYLEDIRSVHDGQTANTVFDGAYQLSWPGWKFDGRQLPHTLRLSVEIVSVDKSGDERWLFCFEGPNREALAGFKGI